MSAAQDKRVLILGAGYCGLAAAIELGRRQVPFALIEATDRVGGLSRPIKLNGVDFELGPHIYFDKDPEVTSFWKSLIGNDLISRERNNRIFYKGKFIKSPLSVVDVFLKLGPIAVARILASFIAAKFSKRPILNAEDWVIANFGADLHTRFFKVYNEKIWGLPSSEISSDWAGQRIKSSLLSMVYRSIVRDHDFIVKTFAFPLGGSGAICRAQEREIRSSDVGDLRLNCKARRILPDSKGFLVEFEDGRTEHFTDLISTIHLSDLAEVIEFSQKDKEKLNRALVSLLYRDLILVNLIFERRAVLNMKEHWIDVHDPAVVALRVTNFSNYRDGEAHAHAAIGIEYNCFAQDAIWKLCDEEIVETARLDLKKMGISDAAPIASSVVRIPKAYPVYFSGYRNIVREIFDEFSKVDGLVLAGRNAMYKWNNMHHSVKTGLLAARNVLGEANDLFAVKGNVTIGKDSD